MRSRISLCTARDVVQDGDTMEITKSPMATVWAKVDQQNNLPSFVSAAGFVVKEILTTPSHLISCRARVDIDFTTAAWVYEHRLKSPCRWYKVLGVQDDGTDWVIMTCRLVEKSELVRPPVGDLSPQQSSVVL